MVENFDGSSPIQNFYASCFAVQSSHSCISVFFWLNVFGHQSANGLCYTVATGIVQVNKEHLQFSMTIRYAIFVTYVYALSGTIGGDI